MTWDGMVAQEAAMKQIREDHGLEAGRMNAYCRSRHPRLGGSVMYDRGFLEGWWRAVAWMRHQLLEWPSLTADDAIRELGKGEGSLWFPIFGDDSKFWADCPGGHKALVDARGLCDECGHDFLR